MIRRNKISQACAEITELPACRYTGDAAEDFRDSRAKYEEYGAQKEKVGNSETVQAEVHVAVKR